jgi:glycosyltransferase involved in cell wall biosynthesis
MMDEHVRSKLGARIDHDESIDHLGHVGDIAERLRYLHDNPDEARRMGERGRAIIQANSWGWFSEQALDGYRSVIESLN